MEVMKNYIVKVENMTCGHCKTTIEKKALEAGGKNVEVNLENKTLSFDGDEGVISKVIEYINETGIYKATKI